MLSSQSMTFSRGGLTTKIHVVGPKLRRSRSNVAKVGVEGSNPFAGSNGMFVWSSSPERCRIPGEIPGAAFEQPVDPSLSSDSLLVP